MMQRSLAPGQQLHLLQHLSLGCHLHADSLLMLDERQAQAHPVAVAVTGAVAGAVAGVPTLPRPAAAAAVGPRAGDVDDDAIVAGAIPSCA